MKIFSVSYTEFEDGEQEETDIYITTDESDARQLLEFINSNKLKMSNTILNAINKAGGTPYGVYGKALIEYNVRLADAKKDLGYHDMVNKFKNDLMLLTGNSFVDIDIGVFGCYIKTYDVHENKIDWTVINA